MKYRTSILTILLFCAITTTGNAGSDKLNCAPNKGLTLQILGSGGPVADDGRASTGYLLWINGRSRFLIDSGGGIFLRFGEAGARFEDLQHIAISHFHTDHSTDLVALLKSAYFSGDQNGSSDAFVEFASGTNVLVMHMPVPEGITGVGRKLHAPPSIIGKIATKTGAEKLVLSHFMARSLNGMEDNLIQIRSRYNGPLISANDLDCINF